MRLTAATIILAALGLTACTHVRGVVQDETSGRPLPTAIISIGRPDGIAVYSTHPVDKAGRFDFQLFLMDQSNVFVYDGQGDATLAQHVDPRTLSDHMVLGVRPGELHGLGQ